jgi:hypothetical protein
MGMFILGAATAAGLTWVLAVRPAEVRAAAPDRLANAIVVTGNVTQGRNGFYLIDQDRTTWYLHAVVIDSKTVKMSTAPRRSLNRDMADVVKDLGIRTPRRLDFSMVTGQVRADLDLVYIYELNTRVLLAYVFDVRRNEISRLSFTQLKKR